MPDRKVCFIVGIDLKDCLGEKLAGTLTQRDC